jgi:hypothetical protein
MKRILLPIFALALTSLTFTSCADDDGGLSNFINAGSPAVKNTIQPAIPGNYNNWLLGNIAQYGNIETRNDNDFTAWEFYVICSGGFLEQVNNRYHWAGEVSGEEITIDAAQDDDWNNWEYHSNTYNTSYYIHTVRTDDTNEWNILGNGHEYLFTIKTIKTGEWNRWEIVGTVPESHSQSLIGLFFVPVFFATTQPVMGV